MLKLAVCSTTMAKVIKPLLLICFFVSSTLACAKQVDVAVIDSPPEIDGKLDDAVWQQATVITDFQQAVPVSGGEPSQKTTVYLARDKDTLYIGARLFEEDPSQIIGYSLIGDESLFGEDLLTIALDTFNDDRNAYVFIVNPVGAHPEARVENNAVVRFEWDTIWYSKVSIDDQGWVVEMAIPAKSVSLSLESDSWGVDIERTIARNTESIKWGNAKQGQDLVLVSGYGVITGMKGLGQGIGLDVIPSSAIRSSRNEVTDKSDTEFKPGLEAVYKITPSLNGSLLINPDFSDTKVDTIQSNLTRFALLFPEQRDFFIRDADIFQFGGLSANNGMPYFSRRIGLVGDRENPEVIDIDVAAKLSGRVGRFTTGLMSLKMDDYGAAGSQQLSVARATMDVGKDSRLGVIATNGSPLTDIDNSVWGVDYRYRNNNVLGGEVLVVDAFYLQSDTENVDGDEAAFGVRVDLPNDTWNIKGNFIELQENYNPSLGFVNRTGIRQYDGDVRRRVRFSDNKNFRTVDFGFRWTTVTNLDNEIESNTMSLRLYNAEGVDGSKIESWWNYRREDVPAAFEMSQGVIVPQGDYVWHEFSGLINLPTINSVRGDFAWTVGDFYDGERLDVRGNITWNANQHLLLGYEHQHIDVELSTGDFNIEFNRVWIGYNINADLKWTNYLQQETENSFMTINSQLNWVITPGNELTLTLNHDMRKERDSYVSQETRGTVNLFWTFRF